MGIWYCTREDVKSALDSKTTARNDEQIDRAIESASRGIDKLCRRRFWPQTGTRYKNWPERIQRGKPWVLYLGQDEAISLDTVTSGGVEIPSTDYFLEPVNSGPPYTRIEIDLDSSAAFSSGSTSQRSVELEGVFGGSADESPAGALAEALDGSETAVDVTNSAIVGVGDLLRVDSERMSVTGKTMKDTGQDLVTDLAAQASGTTVVIGSNTGFNVGETVLLDSERMLIIDISGAQTLTVKRAWDGSVLATHAASSVYAPRTLTVERGAAGTTAATHSDAAPLVKNRVPGPVRALAIAESLDQVLQEQSGYARTQGSGDNERPASGAGLRAKRKDVFDGYARKLLYVGAI